MRLASTDIIRQAADHAVADLERAVVLWQYVAEQKLLAAPAGTLRRLESGQIVPVGLPAAESGQDYSDEPKPATSADMVGEAVASGRREVEHGDRRAQLVLMDSVARLRDHMAGVEDSIKRIRSARLALGAQVPAIDAAIAGHAKSRKVGIGPDGRVGTSGVTAEEADRQRKGAVEAEASCLACEHGVSQVGRLRGGMCDTDRKAWERAGRPDRQPWLIERRARLEAKAAGEAEIVDIRTRLRQTPAGRDHRDAYRDDLREVA